MKKTLITITAIIFSFQIIAQDYSAPSPEQQAEWRKIAHEEAQKTVVSSTVKNFFKNKLILLVVGGAVVAIGSVVFSKKDETK